MRIEISVPEVKSIFKEIVNERQNIFEMIRMNVQEEVGKYLSELMNAELSHFLGRGPYERKEEEPNYRNGSYGRNFTIKGIGDLAVKVPRDRKGDFQTRVIPRSQRYEKEIGRDLCLMFLAGVSTRTLSALSERLIGRKLSHTEISEANKELKEAVEKWRTRDLSKGDIQYLFMDGVNFDMRVGDSIEKVSVLVVIGVTKKRQRMVLALQAGDKESASSWRELFKDLKGRGLSGDGVTLGIMDGLSGLEKVFREEFPKARVQRCQVHVARNVLAKVPGKHQQAVADDLRSIFYASSKDKAKEFFAHLKNNWERELPSAVKCLENSLEACMTFFSFPQEEWISLRTTNIIERLNKEFKRRTKPMEILAGESSCYTLLAFIALKMELQWRSNPLGKVSKNLPIWTKLEKNNFTQNT